LNSWPFSHHMPSSIQIVQTAGIFLRVRYLLTATCFTTVQTASALNELLGDLPPW
jgi:hypothetical protein